MKNAIAFGSRVARVAHASRARDIAGLRFTCTAGTSVSAA
jgi:hypothetical protein